MRCMEDETLVKYKLLDLALLAQYFAWLTSLSMIGCSIDLKLTIKR